MEWRDSGFILVARRHGETAAIVEILTAEHGRHAGLVRGGQSPKRRALLQPGNAVEVIWRARLPEHLGTVECELVRAHAARFLDDPERLAGLTAAASLVAASLPEREPHGDIYRSFARFVESLDSGRDWAAHYVAWECELLTALGYGLDLSTCAVTGVTADLIYVSPRTGRAVSREAGRDYRDKLLPLPGFLTHEVPADQAAIVSGLTLTGYFLHRHLMQPQGRNLPEARERLVERMRRVGAVGTLVP
jgi:DNA repair protein RecO (recombination protein O)